MAINQNDVDTSSLGNYDFGEAIDASNINRLTAPAANSNGVQTGSGWVSNVTKGILDLFDNGLAVYQKVNAITGGATQRATAEQQAKANQTVSVGQTSPVAFGMNQSQLLMIGGGLVVLALVVFTRKRA